MRWKAGLGNYSKREHESDNKYSIFFSGNLPTEARTVGGMVLVIVPCLPAWLEQLRMSPTPTCHRGRLNP